MPHGLKESPWRRITLQIVLCAMLAGTLGLAYLMRWTQSGQSRVVLAEPEMIGGLLVRPPLGWKRHGDGDGLVFVEPAPAGQAGRVLRIWQEACDQFTTPVEYLRQTGRMNADEHGSQKPWPMGGNRLKTQVRMLGDWPGVIVARTRWVQAGERAISWKQCLACTLVPQRGALLVSLEGQGEVAEADDRLLAEIASAAAPVDALPARRGGMIDLRQGMRTRAPARLVWSSEVDPFRSSKQLLGMEGSGYLAAELVPCIVAGGGNEKPRTRATTQPSAQLPVTAMGHLLSLRQGVMSWDAIRSLDGRTAQYKTGASGGGQVAYLRLNADGRALLADFRFHGMSAEHADAAIGRAWGEIERDLRFGREYSVGTLIQEGAAARAQLPGDASAFPRRNPWEQSWQWYQETRPQTAGARFVYRTDDREVAGSFSSEGSPVGGAAGEALQWRLRSNWSSYASSVVHASSGGAITGEALLQAGKYTGALSRGNLKQIVRQPAGNNFIPGGILPLAMAHLPMGPMVVRSEWVPSTHGWLAAEPMTLLLTPADDLPRYDAEGKLLRCWRVEVSGTGEASRWYIDSHGELVSIAFGGGLHLQRVEESPATPPVE